MTNGPIKKQATLAQRNRT